jgi:hypothetical protein
MSIQKGKIGRLPEAIREEIDRRLADGEPAGSLLAWLNGLPAVQSVLAGQFDGQRVNEMNLSRWRTGGHQDWRREQERRAVVRELSERLRLGEVKAEAEVFGAEMQEHLATVLMADFAVASNDLMRHGEEPGERWRQLRGMLHTVNQQRRGRYLTERLKWEQACERQARTPDVAEDDLQEQAALFGLLQRAGLDKHFAVPPAVRAQAAANAKAHQAGPENSGKQRQATARNAK